MNLAIGDSGAVASSSSRLALADRHEVRPHLLARHLLGRLDLEPERVAIERERGLEILHGDADVIENGFHHEGPSARVSPSASKLVRRRVRIDLARGDPIHHRRELAWLQHPPLQALHEPLRDELPQPELAALAAAPTAPRSEWLRKRQIASTSSGTPVAARRDGLQNRRPPLVRPRTSAATDSIRSPPRADPRPRDRPC